MIVLDSVLLADVFGIPERVVLALDSVGLADNTLINKLLVVSESICVAEVVECGVGGKKTRLFLVLGDLAIQLNSD